LASVPAEITLLGSRIILETLYLFRALVAWRTKP
jgi:hypothetical protein